ncbi:MAG TPA: histidinol-phosphatase HisJ family protein [Clostridium sp.]|uniref:histidinol-phosphatase HisJ family protein n=1 Tax=Clostridium sp. TaxID=1506 RepID=UPI002F921E43
MLADYHIHTSFSDDSTYPMDEEIKKAISLRLDEICFTEHIDYGVKTELNCDCESYHKEFLRCKEKFGSQIGLKFGIEFGMQTNTVSEFQKTFDSYNFDFVILSCHQVDNKEFWRQDFQNGKTQKEYNERYYEEILKVMQMYDNYCVLGHLDMIIRYDKGGEYAFMYVKDIIMEILKYSIAHGKGIEVNTSCFRYGLKDLTPSREILKLYKELGGTIITIGSDAHQEDHVGFKISYAQEELKKLGYTHIYTYEKMIPIIHEL